jgi:hypothetical protein
VHTLTNEIQILADAQLIAVHSVPEGLASSAIPYGATEIPTYGASSAPDRHRTRVCHRRQSRKLMSSDFTCYARGGT